MWVVEVVTRFVRQGAGARSDHSAAGTVWAVIED